MQEGVSQRPGQRVYIMFALLLLFMIMSRLTWMQLRHYSQHASLDAMISSQVSSQVWPQTCAPPKRLPPEQAPALVTKLAGHDAGGLLWLSPGLQVQEWVLCNVRPLLGPALSWQMVVFVVTVMAAAWLARFLTSSWIVALLVGATLLSRGAMLSRLGTLGSDLPLALCLTLWIAALAHFLRTGAGLSFLLANIAVCVACLYEPACLVLFLALPCFLTGCYLFCRGRFSHWYQAYEKAALLAKHESEASAHRTSARLRQVIAKFRRVMEGSQATPLVPPPQNIFERGNLFRTIQVPFIFWIYHNRRWLKLSLASSACFVLFAATVTLLYGGFWQWPTLQGQPLFGLVAGEDFATYGPLWLYAALEPIDLHYFVCLALVLTCCMSSPVYGLTSFMECLWILCLSLLLLAAGSLGKGVLQFTILRAHASADLAEQAAGLLSASKMFIWLEPVLLTLGIVCLYHLIKVFETRLDGEPTQRRIAARGKVH